MELTDKEVKKRKLLEAFSNSQFQKDIKNERSTIEKMLLDALEAARGDLKSTQLVFRNLESRIKTEHSFSEKLERRDYLSSWHVTDSLAENISTIKANLDDLIGFRATCYFFEDEKPLFDALEKRLESKKLLYPSITFDFNVSHKQNNGKDIWKFIGRSNGISFEVQIKSIINTIWSEVEHEGVYKNKNYNIYDDAKEKMASSIFDILKGSNGQLSRLFSLSYSQTRLLEGLFFLSATPVLKNNGYCDVQSVHFDRFFAVMRDIRTKEKFDEDLKTFISDYLRNEKTTLKIKRKKSQPTNGMISLVEKHDSYSMRIAIVLYQYMYGMKSNPFPTTLALFLDNARLRNREQVGFETENVIKKKPVFLDQEIYLKQRFGEDGQ
jgi:ppGpp synthetase/RelA/SpoT-type nucleotidyltranferase